MLKEVVRKGISLSLSIIILISSIIMIGATGSQATFEEYPELLPNNGFEELDEFGFPVGYEPFGVNSGIGSVHSVSNGKDGKGVKISPIETYIGGNRIKSYSIRVSGGDAVLPLEGGSDYVLEFDVKCEVAAQFRVTVRQVRDKNGSNEGILNPWHELTNYVVTGDQDTNWRRIACYFNTDANTNFGSIWFIADEGDVILDNVSLKKVQPEGLISNPGFERMGADGSIAGWEGFSINGGTGKAEHAIGEGVSGTAAAKITADYHEDPTTGYSLRIPDDSKFGIKGGTDYKLTYWVKCLGDAQIWPSIRQVKLVNGVEENSSTRPYYDILAYKVVGTGNSWRKVEAYFRTDDDTERAAIWLIAKNGIVYIDNIELEEYVESGLIPNPGFERADQNNVPAGWEGFSVNGGEGTVSSMTDQGINGTTAALINPINATYALRTPDEARIPVKPKTSYVLSYQVKGLEEQSSLRVTIPQVREDKQTGTIANPFFELSAYSVTGKSDDYRQVKAYFRTDEDAAYISVWFCAWGGGVLIDDVSLNENTEAYYGSIENCNLGFEEMESSTIKNWNPVNIDIVRTIKNDYRTGSQSVNLVGSNLREISTYTNMEGIPVTEGKSYRFTAWFKSRNSLSCKISLKAIGADKTRSVMNFQEGAPIILSADEEYSDWMPVSVTYTPAADVTNVMLQICLSKGDYDVLLDDIRVLNLEEAIYFEKFSSLTQQDRPDDWETYGNTDHIANGDDLTIIAQNNQIGGWERVFTELKSNTNYIINGVMTGIKGKLSIHYYDYLDRLIDSVEKDIYASLDSWTEFSFDIKTPSFTYAIISIENKENGMLSFDNLSLKQTSDSVEVGTDWSGYWIWYSEDYTTSLHKPRYFRDVFTLSEKPHRCVLQMTADDIVTLYVNGIEVKLDGDSEWSNIKNIDIANYLHKGQNILAFTVTNIDFECGLLYEALPVNQNGDILSLISSDRNTRSTKIYQPNNEWIELEYIEGGDWYNSTEKGRPPMQPWGVIPYDATVRAANSVEIVDFNLPKQIKGGSKIKFSAVLHIEEQMPNDFDLWISLWRRNTTDEIVRIKLDVDIPTNKWIPQKDFKVNFSFVAPDFIPDGHYTIQFDPNIVIITNDEYINNKVKSFHLIRGEGDGHISTSEIRIHNGSPRLYVNGRMHSPMLFYRNDTLASFKEEYTSEMGQSGIDLVALFPGNGINTASKLWLGVKENGENIYDFSIYDKRIYQVLAGNPNARLMISFDASVPNWWGEKYPDEMSYNKNGESDGASFASRRWRNDMKKVINDLIDHLKNQPYAKYICAFRVTAGRTLEWLPWSDDIIDHSPATEKAFRQWLIEKYKTDIDLQKAWNQPYITFDTVTEPEHDMCRMQSDASSALLDPKTQMQAIDYLKFLAEMTSDAFIEFCENVKLKTNNQWIVGGYFGYIWNAYSYQANGTLHLAVEKALASDYVDFFSAPICYDERAIGESSSYMSMIDSLTANGKLFLSENDIRTVAYQTPYNELDASAHGQTYNMKDTKAALIREFSNQITKGSGMWWYDMSGGWFNDAQIYSLIEMMQEEQTANMTRVRNSKSEVAVFVDEDLYAYTTFEFGPTYNWFYPLMILQRQQLATMGAPYDIYYLSDLVNGNIKKDYKVNIMLSPIEIDSNEELAIERYLKKDNKTIIWIYQAGLSDGVNMDISNTSRITGMDNMQLMTNYSTWDVQLNDNAEYCAGLKDTIYGGREYNSVTPTVTIHDPDAIILGTYSDGSGTSLAAKDMGNWTSIFSSAPNMPARLLTNILKQAGVHIYSNNHDDIIFADSGYVSLHCRYGGKKTITLPEMKAVYDVFGQKLISKNAKTIVFDADNSSTYLFRLTSPNKATVITQVKGQGTISPKGMAEIDFGNSYVVKATPKEGHYLSSITVNGKKVSATNGEYRLNAINENVTITAHFEQLYIVQKDEDTSDENKKEPEEKDEPGNGMDPSEDSTQQPDPIEKDPDDNEITDPVEPDDTDPKLDEDSKDKKPVITEEVVYEEEEVLDWLAIISLLLVSIAGIAAITVAIILYRRKRLSVGS